MTSMKLVEQHQVCLSAQAQSNYSRACPSSMCCKYLVSHSNFCCAAHIYVFQTELKYLLQPPFEKAAETAFSMYDLAAARVFVEHGIVDRMAATPSGTSVDTLQSELNLDSQKITTILRHLSASGWVRETQNGVFALNRCSLTLLQGQRSRTPIR